MTSPATASFRQVLFVLVLEPARGLSLKTRSRVDSRLTDQKTAASAGTHPNRGWTRIRRQSAKRPAAFYVQERTSWYACTALLVAFLTSRGTLPPFSQIASPVAQFCAADSRRRPLTGSQRVSTGHISSPGRTVPASRTSANRPHRCTRAEITACPSTSSKC